MKRLSLLLFFLLTIFTLSAQDGISILSAEQTDMPMWNYRIIGNAYV